MMRLLAGTGALGLLALTWVLGWLPLSPGYLLVRLSGVQMETSLANLALAACLLLMGLQLLLMGLWLPGRVIARFRSQRQVRQFLRLLGAALEGDWQRVEKEAEQRGDNPAEQLLTAMACWRDGRYPEALQRLEPLEAVSGLSGGARLLRAEVLYRHQGAVAALEVLDESKIAPTYGGWFTLRLKLLVELERWSEVRQLLQTPEQKHPSVRLVASDRRLADAAGRQLRQHLLSHTETPNLVLERFRDLDDPDEAEQALSVAIARLLQLHQPHLAADLLAEHLPGPWRETAAGLCFLLPPGNHCRAPLRAAIEAMEQFGAGRQMQAVVGWLQLCTGDAASAGETLSRRDFRPA